MSIKLTQDAWEVQIPSGEKLTLLALCSMANDHGDCHPTVATIGRRCGTAERSTQLHLSALETRGLIARTAVPGEVTRYKVMVTK